jgi:energy-coupling factor transporter transmembrane protein EcfT
MGYLKIIFYGLLAFIERNPKFCLLLVLIAVFAPFVFKWVGWVLLIILGVALLGLGFAFLRFHKMQKRMEDQMHQTMGGGFSGMGGFTNMGGFQNMGANGMSLEELVRQMQAQADARKAQTQQQPKQSTTTQSKSSVDSSDYVDFEEVK